MHIPLALTYDDVLIVPRKSTLDSRKEANTTTRITRNLRINIPIVSANMDTVTESEMAIALARLGGIGIIHRFMSIEKQRDYLYQQYERGPRIACIGIGKDQLVRLAQLTRHLRGDPVEGVLIDVAHGHSHQVIDQIKQIINSLPEDSTYDDIFREIAFARMVQNGLRDSRENRTISNEDMEHRIKSWRK